MLANFYSLLIRIVDWFSSFYFNRVYVKGIPVVASDSVLGFSKALLVNSTGDGHRVMLKLAERHGKLFQFHLLGQHVVAVNDKHMAKEVLKNVTGKGFFHVTCNIYSNYVLND